MVDADLRKEDMPTNLKTKHKLGPKKARKRRNQKKSFTLLDATNKQFTKTGPSNEVIKKSSVSSELLASSTLTFTSSPLKFGIELSNHNIASSNESVSSQEGGDFNELVCCGTAIYTLPKDLFESDSDAESFHDCCNY